MATPARALRPPTNNHTPLPPAAPPAAARTHAPAAPSRRMRPEPPALRLATLAGAGEPLSSHVRAALEKSLRADLSRVRVHTDARSRGVAAGLSARAFTYGEHVFLGPGASADDLGLMAHEAAHVLQQWAAPAPRTQAPGAARDAFEREAEQAAEAATRGETFEVRRRTGGPRVQTFGLSDILDVLANLAANFPGYTLLTVILGRNPINMRAVERNSTNILRGFMGFILGGEVLFQVLNRQGVVERLGSWVSEQLNALGLTYSYLRGRFNAFTDSLGWRDLFRPGDVWRRAQGIFAEPVNRIRSFVSRLVARAVALLKETFMRPLSEYCRSMRGYTLVTVLLGRDPFTGANVPRTALGVVRAFAEFIPGGPEKVNQLVESRALQRAYEWFLQETQARNLTWARVAGTFTRVWDSLRLEDVLSPFETIRRVAGMFGPLLSDLLSFAGAALIKLLELIFEAVMGAGGRRVLAILRRARATFLTIIRNPVGFLRNLLGAVGRGVRQFMTNILSHLREGVIAWLTGPVARAGIRMPERWDARGVIWFALQILGLTWARVREKLVRLIGARAVAVLEAGFQLVQDIRERGLVQALRERVTEFFGQLREAALGQIRAFVERQLVRAGIVQLLSLLNPVGAVIQAIVKTYETVNFFIQRLDQIENLVEAVVDSVAAIASGAIGPAANYVERTMARTIPVILDFLARFIGLGDVGAHVQRTIRGLQARVDQMLDRAVDWIRERARALLARAAGGPPEQRLDQALTAAQAAANRFAGRRVGALVLRPLLAAIRIRYQLRTLEAVQRGPRWAVRGAVNPEGERPTNAQVEGAASNLGEGVRFNAGGESHRLWFAVSGASARLMVASNGGRGLLQYLQNLTGAGGLQLGQQQRATALIGSLRNEVSQVSRRAANVIAGRSDERLDPVLAVLSRDVAELFTLFGEDERLLGTAVRIALRAQDRAAQAQLAWLRLLNELNIGDVRERRRAFASTVDGELTMTGETWPEFLPAQSSNPEIEAARALRVQSASIARQLRELASARRVTLSLANDAEKQMSYIRPDEPIGTAPWGMCPSCQDFFTGLARRRRRIQIVADPRETHIFYPDARRPTTRRG